MDITHPLSCLTHKSQPFIWTQECQVVFNMLCSQLTNTPILQLPDLNKPYQLFIDMSKFCYSGALTQASTEDSNEALLRILTSEDPLKIVESQTQDLWLQSNVIHPVVYISCSSSQNQCRWPAITRVLQCLYVNKEMFLLLTKCCLKCTFWPQNTTLNFHRTHWQWQM